MYRREGSKLQNLKNNLIFSYICYYYYISFTILSQFWPKNAIIVIQTVYHHIEKTSQVTLAGKFTEKKRTSNNEKSNMRSMRKNCRENQNYAFSKAQNR